jgi:mono/diheme cytochrome c family protein
MPSLALQKKEAAMKQLSIGSVVLGAVLTTAPFYAHAQDALSTGKMAYERYCESCHGTSGKGDGPLARVQRKPPADLTQLQSLHGGKFPYNQLFDIIDGREDVAAHGPRTMPVWAKVFKEEETEAPPCEDNECFYTKFWRGRILAIIAYLETLQRKHRRGGYREW